jgi:hypothetical protein
LVDELLRVENPKDRSRRQSWQSVIRGEIEIRDQDDIRVYPEPSMVSQDTT